MTLQDAVDYINFNIKEGVWSPEDFKDMTNAQLIEFAEKEQKKADAYANDNEKNQTEN